MNGTFWHILIELCSKLKKALNLYLIYLYVWVSYIYYISSLSSSFSWDAFAHRHHWFERCAHIICLSLNRYNTGSAMIPFDESLDNLPTCAWACTYVSASHACLGCDSCARVKPYIIHSKALVVAINAQMINWGLFFLFNTRDFIKSFIFNIFTSRAIYFNSWLLIRLLSITLR